MVPGIHVVCLRHHASAQDIVYIPAEHNVQVLDSTQNVEYVPNTLYVPNTVYILEKTPQKTSIWTSHSKTQHKTLHPRLNTKHSIHPKHSICPSKKQSTCPRLNTKDSINSKYKKTVYIPHLELYTVCMYIQNLVHNLKINYKIYTNKNIQTAKNTVWKIVPKQHLGTRIINNLQNSKYKLGKIKST